MKKSKHGISNLLKVLYGLLFTLSLVIIITFYVDKGNSSQMSYEQGLKKQIEALALQIDQEDVEEILFSNADHLTENSTDGPIYKALNEKILATHKIIDIKSSEIRLLQKNTDQSMSTIISSDDIYKYGEKYRDRTGQFSSDFMKTNQVFARINDDLTKIFLTTPIFNANNEPLAYLLISAPESPYWEKMNKSMIKNIAILLLIYFILGVFFMRSLRNNRDVFATELIKTKNIKEQLEVNNKELNMLSLVAKSSKDLILITDHKGIILWINDGYKNKNNYSKSEIENFIGQSLLNVSKNKQIGNIIKNASSFKEEFTYETKSLDKFGNEFWAETIVKPVLKNEELTQIIFIDRNITEIKQLTDQLSLKELQLSSKVNTTINL